MVKFKVHEGNAGDAERRKMKSKNKMVCLSLLSLLPKKKGKKGGAKKGRKASQGCIGVK